MLATIRAHAGWSRTYRRAYVFRRYNTTLTSPTNASLPPQRAWLFVSGIYPVRLGFPDPRHLPAMMQREQITDRLRTILNSVSENSFTVLRLESSVKHGGVFVQFACDNNSPEAVSTIQRAIEEEAPKHGGIETWLSFLGFKDARVWRVSGEPWLEDLNRYVTPFLKIEFEGPDVHEEDLYELMRPYGKIHDITAPAPVPAGNLRFSTVAFSSLRSAAVAHSCIHGLHFTNEDGKITRLKTVFERTRKANWFRDWVVSHPRISLPVAVFLIGSLSYAIFDPIRTLVIEWKMLKRFDIKELTFVKWLRANTLDRFHFHSESETVVPVEAWADREQSEGTLKSYLADYPTTVTFMSGPVGSGKTSLMKQIVKDSGRRAMFIDCDELFKGGTDSTLLSSLAKQTGYWPLFTFVNQMSGLLDMAAVGLIGQKTGFNSTLNQQVRDILQVVASGLQGVSSQYATQVQRQTQREQFKLQEEEHRAELVERIKRGAYHDGRIDCVAGNGVMSELGIGDERMTEKDKEAAPPVPVVDEQGKMDQDVKFLPAKPQDRLENVPENIKALPVVVIKNFASRDSQRGEILDVFAEWTRALVENQIAHVIVLSDNRENSKRLAKAMPSRPLTSVTLSDADATSAVSYLSSSLSEGGRSISLTKEQTAKVQMLGGRASDLQMLVHKVRSGQGVEDAVNDIVSRGINELRKNAFGDDLEDAKNLPWTREQAWAVVKKLADKSELPYFDTLLEFPFKGDEMALRAMEHAELISIHTNEGRPASIRPGRPVYKVVFQRLVQDSIFQATQELAYNEKAIASAEKTIATCETEMSALRELANESYMSRAAKVRAKYLSNKMQEAQGKIEGLETKNVVLKKTISHGH